MSTKMVERSRYQADQTYDWNFDHPPQPVEIEIPEFPGSWTFCGRPVGSPLGVPAGPLLNGAWCLYYASLGFDVLTYKTVRSVEHPCYPLPNLLAVDCGQLSGTEQVLPVGDAMRGSWAVSFGMPSKDPGVWREDVARTRVALPPEKLLVVSVVGTVQPDWSLRQLGDDYARCAAWAVEAGADAIETNFSCPNVATCDGQLYEQPADAAIVAEQVRAAIGDTPFLVKVGHLPHAEHAEALIAVLAPLVDGLAMTNSVATKVVGDDGQEFFDGHQRGICGDAIRTASLAQVQLCRDIVDRTNAQLDIVGVGGASTDEHVRQYLDAGATAVHLATAAMVDPEVALKIRAAWQA